MRLDKKQAAFGYVFLARNKFSAAAAQFSQALETNPENLEASMGLATIHEFEGDNAAAFQIYGKLLATNPDDAWIKLRYEYIQLQRHAGLPAGSGEGEKYRQGEIHQGPGAGGLVFPGHDRHHPADRRLLLRRK